MKTLTYIREAGTHLDTRLQRLLQGNDIVVKFSAFEEDPSTWILKNNSDCVILDIKTRQDDSLSLCSAIRARSRVPVVILSEKYSNLYHIQALASGADDVIKKPFHPTMLVAKLSALIRRFGPSETDLIRFGDLQVNFSKRDVLINGREALLSSIEFDIIAHLAQNAGHIVSRNDMHKALYNSDHNGIDRSLDMYISRIRKKIGDDPARPRHLKTIRGEGYLFVGRAGKKS